MITLFITLLLCIIAALTYGCYNIIKQNEILENLASEHIEVLELMKFQITKVLEDMDAIDIKGAFKADDEVGTTFDNLKLIVQQLEMFLDEQYNRNNTGE
jgi:hypothetical protein